MVASFASMVSSLALMAAFYALTVAFFSTHGRVLDAHGGVMVGLLGLRSCAHKPQGFGAFDRLPVSPSCIFGFVLHRGVNLRRFDLHFSVAITVPLVLFAGVFRLFCLSWWPRGLDSSPRFF